LLEFRVFELDLLAIGLTPVEQRKGNRVALSDVTGIIETLGMGL
jgi:hypothetical protein